MKAVTLADLKLAVRERADMVDDPFISDAELTRMINRSWAALYDILIMKFQDYYFVEGTPFQTVAGTTSYNLPDDCYKLLGVDLQVPNSTRWFRLGTFSFRERNSWLGKIRYTLTGNLIRFNPTPTKVNNIKLYYAPPANNLVGDYDTIDGVNGWEEYIINDCAIKCKIKADDNCVELQGLKAEVVSRIESVAAERDYREPKHISKVEDSCDYLTATWEW